MKKCLLNIFEIHGIVNKYGNISYCPFLKLCQLQSEDLVGKMWLNFDLMTSFLLTNTFSGFFKIPEFFTDKVWRVTFLSYIFETSNVRILVDFAKLNTRQICTKFYPLHKIILSIVVILSIGLASLSCSRHLRVIKVYVIIKVYIINYIQYFLQ